MKKQKRTFFSYCYYLYLLLSVFVIIAGAGCGKKEPTQTQLQKISEKISGKDSEEVYKYQTFFQEPFIKAVSVSDICKTKNKIYMLGLDWKSDQKTGDYIRQEFLFACDIDGSNAKRTEIPTDSKESILRMTVDKEGRLQILISKKKEKQYYTMSSTNKADDKDTFPYYAIETLGEDGSRQEKYQLSMKKINKAFSYPNENNIILAEDGTVYTIGTEGIYVFDSTGKSKAFFETEKYDAYGLFQLEDGSVYVYGECDEPGNMLIKKLDLEKNKLLPAASWDTSYRIYNPDIRVGNGTIVYVNDGENLYQYNVETGDIELLLCWINYDIDADIINTFSPMEDGALFIASIAEESRTAEIAVIKSVKASERKEKKLLTLFCGVLQQSIKEHVLAFNKTNENYRIEVTEYSAYETDRLNLDIMTGTLPDILCLQQLPADLYARKGLLADLYSFMEKDEEIKKEDFIDSVRNTAEMNGKLYYMGPTFCIQALAIGKKTLGNNACLTFEMIQKLRNSLPEQGEILVGMSRQDFLEETIREQMEKYVNWEIGEVFFDTEDFIQILELAKEFPDQNDIDYNAIHKLSIRDGEVLMEKASLSSMEDFLKYQKKFEKNGGYTMIPYPNSGQDNRLAMLFSAPALAITEQSSKSQGAWEFVRRFLTYEYQQQGENDNSYLPTRKDALKQKMQYAMATEEYTTEDGTKIEPIETGAHDGEYVLEVGPLEEKEVDKIWDIIGNVGILSSTFDTVANKTCEIAAEESEAFFAGDKTAKATAEIIQNRMRVYISENS